MEKMISGEKKAINWISEDYSFWTSSWFLNLLQYVAIIVLTAEFLRGYQQVCYWKILHFKSTNILGALPYQKNQNT